MPDTPVHCNLRQHREKAGLSQAALAAEVGVSRQALVAIEGGRQVPSTRLALQLSAALGCSVEQLFRLPPAEPAPVLAALANAPPLTGATGRAARVVLGQLGGRWVAHRVSDDACLAADGLLVAPTSEAGSVHVEPLASLQRLQHNVLVAGCAPLLGVLAQRVAQRYEDARVTWLQANSSRALDLLEAGFVHLAGLHLVDERSGEGNLSLLRDRFAGRGMRVVNLTRWRQGLVLAKGNPLGIRDVHDLQRSDVRVVRREQGAGATLLLARLLGESELGRGPVAAGHAAVSQLVCCGAADVGVAIESAALAAELDFVPLSEERFDLVVPAELADHGPVQRLLDLLTDRAFRAEAAQLPGYDLSLSGHTTALDASGG